MHLYHNNQVASVLGQIVQEQGLFGIHLVDMLNHYDQQPSKNLNQPKQIQIYHHLF